MKHAAATAEQFRRRPQQMRSNLRGPRPRLRARPRYPFICYPAGVDDGACGGAFAQNMIASVDSQAAAGSAQGVKLERPASDPLEDYA